MKKWVVLIFFLLGACAGHNSASGYGAHLSHWVGWPETKLYASWGKPAQVFYVMPNEKIVSYFHKSGQGRGDVYGGLGTAGTAVGRFFQELFEPAAMYRQPQIYYCKTSFVIRDGIVVQYNFNGDYCGG